ncbi:MAG: glycosyltransferase [Patulibacter minatonensis]
MTHSVLALHHGYRVAGGEERAAEQLADLAERELGERVAWLRRDSTAITGVDAARGLLAGGLGGRQVTEALERTGADLLHAHNLFPTFGPVALRAARKQGAAVVVHLHNTRLVCAVATNVRDGRDCTECHGSWSVPGIRHRCRGSLPESVAYGAALPRWRKEVVAIADAVIVPSLAARSRLLALGLGVPLNQIHVVGGVAPTIADRSTASTGRFALLVGRLAPEKDIATAIEACAAIGLPLVIAGDGPEAAALQSLAGCAGAGRGGAPRGRPAAGSQRQSVGGRAAGAERGGAGREGVGVGRGDPRRRAHRRVAAGARRPRLHGVPRPRRRRRARAAARECAG